MDMKDWTPTEWSLLIVFVPKRDETLRFWLECLKLNAMEIWDSFPILRIEKCLDSLDDARKFSTLDVKSIFWQVETAEDFCNKNPSEAHQVLFLFNRMQIVLKIAPGTSNVRWISYCPRVNGRAPLRTSIILSYF